jgi:hypothetical protein
MPIASSASPVEPVPAARSVLSAVRSRITWLRAAEAALLIVTLGLRLWALDQNGFGIEYYSAAVRSMMRSWHNFLYNSFDPAGFVSVDKPPVALWIQAVSARLFGFRPASVLLPQVLEGVGSVWLLYCLVQKRFGAVAGLLAGLFLAITPSASPPIVPTTPTVASCSCCSCRPGHSCARSSAAAWAGS